MAWERFPAIVHPDLQVPPPDAQCALDLNIDTVSAGSLADGPAIGVLCPAFDRDLFAFDAPADGSIVKVTLSMATAQTRVNPKYKILQDNGTPDGAPTPFSAEDPQKSQGEATDFTAAHRLETAGRYYIAVEDARFVDDSFDIVNEYTVAAEIVADPDANEPNNTDDTATVETGGTFTGQIATNGDEDWYAIDVPAGAQIVDVTISAPKDSGVNHTASLIAADGLTELLAAPLAGASADTVVTARLRSRAVGGVKTYLVVRDGENAASQLDPAKGTYTVTLTVLGNPDPNEGADSNDDAEHATDLTSGAQLTAGIATTADQDFFKIAGGAGTSISNPKVLILTIETDGEIGADFQPQVTILGVDPERANQQACNATCSVCDANKCKNQRLQRFIDSDTFRTAYPLRDQQAVFVVVNESGDDAFQDGTGYTIRAEVIADPDPGEAGDDFLIPNLEFAGFTDPNDPQGNSNRAQYSNSIGRARVLATNYPPICDDAGAPVGCIPTVTVPAPDTRFPAGKDIVGDCNDPGMAPKRVTATGRLSYEGDRDYFRIDVPERSYFAVNFTYSATGAGSTPVELALFMHNGGGGVISNTLETPQTKSGCLDTEDDPTQPGDTGCPDGSICVDGNCWQESDTNATFNTHVFPDQANECSFISPFDGPPYFLEVVDNGINDFDPDVAYTINIDLLCGCPAECNVGSGVDDRCQGVVDPT